MPSKQFGIWLAVTVTAFTGLVFALDALDPGTVWVFAAGILFGESIRPFMSWLHDWQDAEKRVEEVSPDA